MPKTTSTKGKHPKPAEPAGAPAEEPYHELLAQLAEYEAQKATIFQEAADRLVAAAGSEGSPAQPGKGRQPARAVPPQAADLARRAKEASALAVMLKAHASGEKVTLGNE